LAPAGIPSTTVEKLDQEFMCAFADAESAKHNETIGIVPAQSTSAELREWIRPDVAGWSKVLREAGIDLNRP